MSRRRLVGALALLAAAAANPIEGVHHHEVVEITFMNRLKEACSLFWMGKLMHQFERGGEVFKYTSYDGHAWTAADASGQEVFHYVVRAKDGAHQEVDIRRGVVRRTIHSIVSGDDHAQHRVDGGDAYGQDVVGCTDPVLIGDRVLVRAPLKEDLPLLVRDQHRVVSRGGDVAGLGERHIWTVRSDARSAGPLFPGESVFLESDIKSMIDLQPPPKRHQATPLQARWKDMGAWQRFEVFKGPADDGKPRAAICYGEDTYLRAHTGNFVDVHGGRAMARWPHRGEWQTLAFERFVANPPQGGEEEL